jgi:hypothetical protein
LYYIAYAHVKGWGEEHTALFAFLDLLYLFCPLFERDDLGFAEDIALTHCLDLVAEGELTLGDHESKDLFAVDRKCCQYFGFSLEVFGRSLFFFKIFKK